MSRQSLTAVRSQAGFTLVELAVVMIIIGLLIGGVLKGQELVKNAQITSTVAQVKGIDAATSTFRDMYAALPGDIQNPGTRLPSCTAALGACDATGNGNGRLDSAATTIATPGAAPAGESARFFVHLSAADLVSGITPTGVNTAWGSLYPKANVAGGFNIGSSTGAVADFGSPANWVGSAPNGLYLVLTQTAAAVPAVALTPNQAQRIDSKIDDGSPVTGSTRYFGDAACIVASGTTNIYNEAVGTQSCGLYLRIQG